MGSFDSLQIGRTGLFAARQGIDTAGQNIANINTPGYSRQRVDLTADTGPVTPAVHSRWEGNGLGVREAQVTRLRDQFIDRRVREEGAYANELQVGADTINSIELAFSEPSDIGVASVMSDFFAAWDDVANRPEDESARAQLTERGRTLATSITSLKAEIGAIGAVAESRLDSLVAEVNTSARQVAELSDTIVSARSAGLNSNELEDQRDLLLQKLADTTGGSARFNELGQVSFFVNSVPLVRDSTYLELETAQNPGGIEVVWSKDGIAAGVNGKLGGLLTAANETVPGYMAQIEVVEAELMAEVNGLHTSGFDLDGNAGIDFFIAGADGIEINPTVLGNARLVAASAFPGDIDGSIAAQMSGSDASIESYRETVTRLGVEGLSAQRRAELQNAVRDQVTLEQESVNGVNMDEELSNLVKYQRSYEANAKFMSTIDELLQTLINL